jgi:hypothetical protein
VADQVAQLLADVDALRSSLMDLQRRLDGSA